VRARHGWGQWRGGKSRPPRPPTQATDLLERFRSAEQFASWDALVVQMEVDTTRAREALDPGEALG
jgi:hypothetical protein